MLGLTWLNILELNGYEIIPVETTLLVEETKSVKDLVHDDPLPLAATPYRDVLPISELPDASNEGGTPVVT